MTPRGQSVLAAAQDYVRNRKWFVVPVPLGQKGPVITAWQKLRLKETDLAKYFSDSNNNMGILLGVSDELVDVDVDVPEAFPLADIYIPSTGLVSGHKSQPRSHRWFRCPVIGRVTQFKDLNGEVLIELRGGSDESGAQTIAPPSIHNTGEPYVWHSYGEPAEADGDDLLRCVKIVAAGALLARHWPAQGSRHRASLAFCGMLLRATWNEEDTAKFLTAVCQAAKDEDSRTRKSDVRTTARNLAANKPVTGATELKKYVGDEVVVKLREWLRLDWAPPRTTTSKPADVEEVSAEAQSERATPPEFPKAAWRGIFSEYRIAMAPATEASDVFHFAALWARCAVELGRRVHLRYGMKLFPNVYLVGFGPTGDRKTTAMRMATEGGGEFKIVRGGGSGEGLADELSSAEPGQGVLLFCEEFSQILRPGRWEGATLIPFLTSCFDCPQKYEMKFRKKPVNLEQPTPSLLAGTTPTWFWQDLRAKDFESGFGNRLALFTGVCKAAMPLPESPNVEVLSRAVDVLAAIQPCQAHLDVGAQGLWEKFYCAWRAEESRRDPLLLAALQRIPAYILKLSMLYAGLEGTLPRITGDQLAASILVGHYGADCAKELLSLQNAGTNPRKELERRILAMVNKEPSGRITKREIYKTLWRHYSDTEAFNRAFDSLVRAGELCTKQEKWGRIWVSREPLT